MRAWIEVCFSPRKYRIRLVALYMRAWIEVIPQLLIATAPRVALYMRAWIEVNNACPVTCNSLRRPLHEGVD